MAYINFSKAEDLETIRYANSSAVTKGEAVLIGDVQAWALDAYGASEYGVYVIKATRVKVDVASGTYTAGDALYEHATVPTGVLDKVATARTKVAVVSDAASGTITSVEANFDGRAL